MRLVLWDFWAQMFNSRGCLSFNWPFLKTFRWHNRWPCGAKNKYLIICFLLSWQLRLMETMGPEVGKNAVFEDKAASMATSIARTKDLVYFCGQPLCSALPSAFWILMKNFQLPASISSLLVFSAWGLKPFDKYHQVSSTGITTGIVFSYT